MIKIISKNIDALLQHLNQNYDTGQNVTIHILEESDSVQAPNGEIGFGVYIPENAEIYVAAELPEEITLSTIAHEYKHFIQFSEGKDFDEDEAEKFAEEIMEEIFGKAEGRAPE